MKDKIPLIQNTNRNNISIKADSAVQLVRELSKLGVFRKKGKKRAKRSSASTSEGIKQDSNMIGYTKTIGGTQMRNIPPIQQIEAGMTQSQIENIQRQNEAAFAALKGEVQQQRLEDIKTQEGLTMKLAEATAQRFGELAGPVGKITDIKTEHFRGAQEPGAGVYDPFASKSELPQIQDVEKREFTETLNPGAPEYQREPISEIYAESGEEEEGIPTIGGGGGGSTLATIVERERGKRAKAVIKGRDAIASQFNLGPVPPLNKSEISEIREYYITLMLRANPDEEVDEEIMNNKKKLHKRINSILDEQAAVIGSE
jgi:hypothetical protein